MSTESKTKTNWADDVEEADALPPTTRTTGPDGIETIVEWKLNEEGKKVKVTRRIKRTKQQHTVSQPVAERKAWPKFGAEKGQPTGPNTATTTVGENMQFKIAVGKAAEENKEESEGDKVIKAKKIVCRLCKGDHFTSKCPYKETLEGIGMPGGETDDFGAGPTPAEQAAASSSAPSTNGKYVPPSMRGAGAQASSDSRYPGAGGNRDDLPTLRVTNVSDDVEEEDLRLLFDKAIQGRGRIMRVYVGKDRETGQKKGYAFVTCDSKDTAERAMQMLNGKGYANLILSVQFSQPRPERSG